MNIQKRELEDAYEAVIKNHGCSLCPGRCGDHLSPKEFTPVNPNEMTTDELDACVQMAVEAAPYVSSTPR